MGALDTLINLAVDQNRRSNMTDIMDGLQNGSIPQNQALIKLAQTTGDEQDLKNGVAQMSINRAQGLNPDGTPNNNPDGTPALQSIPDFETSLGQNTGNPEVYKQGRVGQAVSGAFNSMSPTTDPMQMMLAAGTAAYRATGDQSYLKGVMETVLNAQKAHAEIDKNKAEANLANANTGKVGWETGGAVGGGGGGGMGASAIPTGEIPQVDASALQQPGGPPAPGIQVSGNPPPQGGIPAPPAGPAALEAQKKAASEAATNAAAAQKNATLMLSNLPLMNNQFNKMRDANKISSFSPLNDEEGEGLATTYHGLNDQYGGGDPAASANATLKTLAAQNVIREIGPQLQQGGVKGNKFLESVIANSSGIDLSASKDARAKQIDLLQNNYNQGLQSTFSQLKAYGIDPTPLIHSALPDLESLGQAYKAGAISKDDFARAATIYHGAK